MLSLAADICLDWNATITLKVGASAGVRCPAGACPLARVCPVFAAVLCCLACVLNKARI